MIYIADLFVLVLIIISYFVDEHLPAPIFSSVFNAIIIPLYLLIVNILSKPKDLKSILIRYFLMVAILVIIYLLSFCLWAFRTGNDIYQADSETKYVFKYIFLMGMFIITFIWVWWYINKHP